MTSDVTRSLAEELTSRFTALDGVRGIFPEHATAAAVLALVTSTAPSGAAVVGVDSRGASIKISARIATSRSVPARVVLAGAASAVADVVGPHPYALDIEFAYID